MRTKVLWIVGIAGFFVGFGAVAAVRLWRHRAPEVAAASPSSSSSQAGQPDPQFVYKVELGESPLRGPADATVTIVEFSSYECAPCRALDQSLRQIADEAGARIRIAWKDLPGSPDLLMAARAVRAAQAQGKFWELHERLMTASSRVEESLVLHEAERMGLDMGKFRADLADPLLQRALEADAAQAQRFGLPAAPAVFVNGRFVANPTPERLRESIADAQAFARQLMADGTPAEKIYPALMRGALASSGPITAASLPDDLIEKLK